MLPNLKLVSQKLVALVAGCALLCPDLARAQQAGYTFKAQAELVLVDISVRDKNGKLIRDLKPEDFTVLEDNKPQKVSSFDVENMENTPAVPTQEVNLLSNVFSLGQLQLCRPRRAGIVCAIRHRFRGARAGVGKGTNR